MKCIVRADDFGITPGTIPAILEGLEKGILTSTGVMTNMNCAQEACQAAKEHPQFCFGQDINIATGKPVAPLESVKGMVDENGCFRRSGLIRKMVKDGEEPFVYEEVRAEIEAQLSRFIALVGRKPAYLNGHAFRTPNFSRALSDVAHAYDIPCMDEIVQTYDFDYRGFLPGGPFLTGWYPKNNDPMEQLNADAEGYVLDHLDELKSHDPLAFFICHPAYIDTDLMECSSLNLVRMQDRKMSQSEKVKQAFAENGIELCSVTEFLNSDIPGKLNRESASKETD